MHARMTESLAAARRGGMQRRAQRREDVSQRSGVRAHLDVADVLPAPEGLEDAVAEAQHGQVLNQLLACGGLQGLMAADGG